MRLEPPRHSSQTTDPTMLPLIAWPKAKPVISIREITQTASARIDPPVPSAVNTGLMHAASQSAVYSITTAGWYEFFDIQARLPSWRRAGSCFPTCQWSLCGQPWCGACRSTSALTPTKQTEEAVRCNLLATCPFPGKCRTHDRRPGSS